ncbi:MAG: hypothetical protein D5R98_09235 [Desulfonatronovibrio sp. MSAO_Bac4]|nr:MAG: hypothetical protein D5R98_09235 [Desulfonatronovibrio sp. MSAO_Bac4]
MDKRPFLIMRKVFYIFLIHILVLGSLWVWRNHQDGEYFSEVINLENGIQVYLGITTYDDSSSLGIEVCFDKENISKSRIQNSLAGFFLMKPDSLSSGFEDAKYGLTCYTMNSADEENLLTDNQ